jgi:plastocyanin
MRFAVAATALGTLVSVFAAVPAGAASKPPVTLDQKVNFEGTKDVSKKSRATVDEELDDKYFAPTFVKAKAGQKITFKLTNEGKLPHTFTSDEFGVDKELQPGQSAKVTLTVPSSGAVFTVYCSLHEADGMVGAIYTRANARATSSAITSDADLKPSDSSDSGGATGGSS